MAEWRSEMAALGSERAEVGLERANLGSIMVVLGHIGPGYKLRTEAIRFEPLKKMQVKTHLFLGCFRSYWDSDGSLLGHRCTVWPPRMWMRSDEAADLVWGGI